MRAGAARSNDRAINIVIEEVLKEEKRVHLRYMMMKWLKCKVALEFPLASPA
jgi:hypothetical protein